MVSTSVGLAVFAQYISVTNIDICSNRPQNALYPCDIHTMWLNNGNQTKKYTLVQAHNTVIYCRINTGLSQLPP